MRVLLVHQNFPGQFKHIAPALIARGDEVVAMGMREWTPPAGLKYVQSRPQMATGRDGHPWSRDFDTKVIRGEATLRNALALRDQGFVPDVILAHPGWGEAMFLQSVWPQARIGLYCEYFYRADGADVDFDPEFPSRRPEEEAARLLVKNAVHYLSFETATGLLSPTRWQASTFPDRVQPQISVIHDGIDTRDVAPRPGVSIRINPELLLSRQDEVVTFVARNLEPYRGYHKFMRALPDLMARRPNAQFLVIGGDGVSYGAAAPEGTTWKQRFLDEVADRIDHSRLHFLGNLPYPAFKAVLALSRVHIYLTFPFVLSWSLMEAMATGCAIVASDTPPVREVIGDRETGLLVPFHGQRELVDAVDELCRDAGLRDALGAAARARIVEDYDLHARSLPQQLAWIDGIYAERAK